MDKNYFDRVKNEGYVGDKKYLDYNVYLREGGRNMDTGNPGNVPSQEEIIRKAIEANKEAIKPAVESYNAQIPEVQKTYANQRSQLEAEKEPLKARYDNLISSIKGNQTVAENRQTVTSRNELGRRGISLQSGLADQTVTDAVNPITSQYTGLIKDTGLEGEKSMRDIVNSITGSYDKETASTRDITNAIASLQANAGMGGVNTGVQNYQFAVQQALQREAAQRQAEQAAAEMALRTKAQSLAERQFNEIDIPSLLYSINKPYYKETAGGGGGAGGRSLEDLAAELGL